MSTRDFVLQRYPEAVIHETKWDEWRVYERPYPNARILGIGFGHPEQAWEHAKEYCEAIGRLAQPG